MTITLYQQSRIIGDQPIFYCVTFCSMHYLYARRLSKKSWLAILDHLWNNPLFTHTKFDVEYYNGGLDAVWTDEFKEC